MPIPSPTPSSDPLDVGPLSGPALQAASNLISSHFCIEADLYTTAGAVDDLEALRAGGTVIRPTTIALLARLLDSTLRHVDQGYSMTAEQASQCHALRRGLVSLGVESLPAYPPPGDSKEVKLSPDAIAVLRKLLSKGVLPPEDQYPASLAWDAMPKRVQSGGTPAYFPKLALHFVTGIVTTYAKGGAVDGNTQKRTGVPGGEARGLVHLLDTFATQ